MKIQTIFTPNMFRFRAEQGIRYAGDDVAGIGGSFKPVISCFDGKSEPLSHFNHYPVKNHYV